MPLYRFHFLNRDNHIARARIVEYPNDAAALERAADLKHAHKVEVWLGSRKVGQVPELL